MTDLEQKIADLRRERERATGAKAADLDRRIVMLVRAWVTTGGKLVTAR